MQQPCHDTEKKINDRYLISDLSPGEASDEEMELFAPSKSSSSEASRRKSSRGSDVSSSKGKFMVEDYKAKGVTGPKPQKEPLQFGSELYDDGMFFNITVNECKKKGYSSTCQYCWQAWCVMFEYMHCRNMEVHVSCHRRGQPGFVALEKLPHRPAPSHREQN